jgi:hypothetical protein
MQQVISFQIPARPLFFSKKINTLEIKWFIIGFDSPLRQEIQSVRGQLWNVLMGSLMLKIMEKGWIYHWTGLTSLTCIKCWRSQTSDQNSTGVLANGKFYAADMTSCLRTWLSSAKGYNWAGKICTSSKGSILKLSHDRLGSGYWP